HHRVTPSEFGLVVRRLGAEAEENRHQTTRPRRGNAQIATAGSQRRTSGRMRGCGSRAIPNLVTRSTKGSENAQNLRPTRAGVNERLPTIHTFVCPRRAPAIGFVPGNPSQPE